ncbi:4Fe-4S dicluster domain-containing protein [Teichococcus oryzae]|uniref:4Fe-4S dicluster domain-containing protein n=1 Tax=Teichococcus oryzae TaxID=1608942 RepID=A0A5B2TGT5_9PROT|nr:4Fe-4S dicluster domain-containing protein [Pseudoroseomonas oryzae]KAA2212990.1 4Fe-4S dicluster domain-containing protein [Pseudoroseomonas oryzae]
MTSPAPLGRRGLLFGKPAMADAPPPRPVAGIAPSCLAFRGIACMSCRDACSTGAIRFTLVRGGAVPRVEADACTGCADCAALCPASAITVAAPAEGEAADA